MTSHRRVVLRADQPVLAAGSPQRGNSIDTLEHIPGTTLWGALAQRYVLDHGGTLNGRTSDFDAIFNGGGVRIGNLYPARFDVSDDKLTPALPIPASAVTCKALPGFRRDPNVPPLDRAVRDPHGVDDRFSGTTPDRCTRERCGAALVQPSGLYIVRQPAVGHDGQASAAEALTPQLRYQLQNEIDDTSGLTRAEVLFSTRALERRQFLSGWIGVDDAVARLAEPLLTAFAAPAPIVLGKARGARGGATLWIDAQPSERTDLWGLTLEDRVTQSAGNGAFTLTLTSDAIVLDGWMRHSTSLEPLLESWTTTAGATEMTVTSAYVRMRRYANWNGIDGCWREEELVIGAGSSFQITAAGHDDETLLALLRRIEIDGIGVRRAEGFGSVLVNDSFHNQVREFIR